MSDLHQKKKTISFCTNNRYHHHYFDQYTICSSFFLPYDEANISSKAMEGEIKYRIALLYQQH